MSTATSSRVGSFDAEMLCPRPVVPREMSGRGSGGSGSSLESREGCALGLGCRRRRGSRRGREILPLGRLCSRGGRLRSEVDELVTKQFATTMIQVC